jgi:hypothetical protein
VHIFCACVAVASSATALFAQESEHLLSKYRKLDLPEAAGPVPVIYSPGAEERALRYQKTLAAAVAWFNEQLGTDIQVALAVADGETWQRVGDPVPYPMPHSAAAGKPLAGLVALPARIENFPNLREFVGDRDPNFMVEAISFHEAGHIFAASLGIWSGNPFVNELIANVFATGLIRAGHPQYAFMTAGPPSTFPAPRYTSLADLDYLYFAVGMTNFGWFQMKLNELSALLLDEREFSGVIEDLKGAFPAAEAQTLPVEKILARIETLRPGFTTAAGPLAGPTTLARTNPTAHTVKDPPHG